jgi:uncharacterized protein (DUF342 family)
MYYSITTLDPEQVPDIALMYWGLVRLSKISVGLYGMDERRVEYHNELCQWYNIDKEESKKITDNLDKYEDVQEMDNALRKLPKIKE